MEKSCGQLPPEGESGDLTFIYQHEMNSPDQYFAVNQIMESLTEELQYPLPSGNYSSCFPFESSGSGEFSNTSCSYVDLSFGRPIATVTREEVSVVEAPPQASSSFNLSFGNQASLHDPPPLYLNSAKGAVEPNNENKSFFSQDSTWSENTLDFQRPEKKCMGSKPPGSQDHVIAERKRRERLNQQFISLSTIIPGLKKTDKASLLRDAINYIRQLEEKVKTLEEKASEKTVESAILVKKSDHPSPSHDDIPNYDQGNPSNSSGDFPRITASLNGSCILVRIQCEKRKGLFVKVLSEIQKHHLTIINTNVMPFASSALNITVTAQVEEGFSMTVKDLVKHIDSALSQFI